MTRIGFVGPAGQDNGSLRRATDFLLNEAGVQQVIYLGTEELARQMLRSWACEIMADANPQEAFLTQAAVLAHHGDSSALEELVSKDTALRRLSALRMVPPAPARVVELWEGRIVMILHDKSHLDEDDIASANLIIYGNSDTPSIKKFGPRYFFTPGPLEHNEIATLHVDVNGAMAIHIFDCEGTPLRKEVLRLQSPRITIS